MKSCWPAISTLGRPAWQIIKSDRYQIPHVRKKGSRFQKDAALEKMVIKYKDAALCTKITVFLKEVHVEYILLLYCTTDKKD
jgi:hypothetical protein